MARMKVGQPHQPPTAVIETPSIDGLSVTMDASASTDPEGDMLQYAWDFGDGSSGSGALASNTYAEAGKCQDWQTRHPEWIFCDDFEDARRVAGQSRQAVPCHRNCRRRLVSGHDCPSLGGKVMYWPSTRYAAWIATIRQNVVATTISLIWSGLDCSMASRSFFPLRMTTNGIASRPT